MVDQSLQTIKYITDLRLTLSKRFWDGLKKVIISKNFHKLGEGFHEHKDKSVSNVIQHENTYKGLKSLIL